ncbi:hypothetical protein P879_11766 [Paragonimus westermani]|uniref:Uncharacterized protein n=1 Tax=Paragonimus westermani TaxID=34504 RepID=A0A8T0D3R5_9TREM|nr:hypothetical protein P879_11766 [Paragonimus westermani]
MEVFITPSSLCFLFFLTLFPTKAGSALHSELDAQVRANEMRINLLAKQNIRLKNARSKLKDENEKTQKQTVTSPSLKTRVYKHSCTTNTGMKNEMELDHIWCLT